MTSTEHASGQDGRTTLRSTGRPDDHARQVQVAPGPQGGGDEPTAVELPAIWPLQGGEVHAGVTQSH